jgi:hypothetical protein
MAKSSLCNASLLSHSEVFSEVIEARMELFHCSSVAWREASSVKMLSM